MLRFNYWPENYWSENYWSKNYWFHWLFDIEIFISEPISTYEAIFVINPNFNRIRTNLTIQILSSLRTFSFKTSLREILKQSSGKKDFK